MEKNLDEAIKFFMDYTPGSENKLTPDIVEGTKTLIGDYFKIDEDLELVNVFVSNIFDGRSQLFESHGKLTEVKIRNCIS